jgi:preprotein translocase subunit SecA
MRGLAKFGRKLLGTAEDGALESLRPLILQINALEAEVQGLPNSDLKAKTLTLRSQVESGAQLDQLLPEAFANCREAVRRALGLRPFDVQLGGGIILHQGKIAEMATGEGKTLVAVFAAYLNSLTGKGVHVATMNDYLAKRDAEWMGKVYAALGVTCGLVFQGQSPARRRAAYRADVTYSTFSEFGFDYLRDNMKKTVEDLVQREHNFAIIDEVDSVLIDEARTPLIISGPSQDKSEFYIKINEIVSHILPEHFDHRENSSITLTEQGHEFAEAELRRAGFLRQDQTLYEGESQSLLLHFMQALRAHKLYRRDQHYIVREQSVILIDASTGRMMPKRRLSTGLHQAIEAKEGVPIKPETATLASMAVQNYFRLYAKLAGMTGTAATDSEEFGAVYNLDVVRLPTNSPVLRQDEPDDIYFTEGEKLSAIMDVIHDAHRRGQPLLVGTASIEKSQKLSEMLASEQIPHSVLNAHHLEKEAEIIGDAGRLGAVTIATNMAGRGTDIQLGGNLQTKIEQAFAANPDEAAEIIRDRIALEHRQEKAAVLAAGGLLVLGTERHASRRIDNQLRGRSGRQGDPGRTMFILSLEDDLVKNLDADWLRTTLSNGKLDKNPAASRPLFKKILDKAQSKAEDRYFQIRKQLLKFDNVMNEQRRIIYGLRLDFMRASDLSEIVSDLCGQFIDDLIRDHLPAGFPADLWDTEGIGKACREFLSLELPFTAWANEDGVDPSVIRSRILDAANAAIRRKADIFGPELMRNLEKQVLLEALDSNWREHRIHLDELRSMIGFRAYARRDPLSEFRTEALDLFEKFLAAVRRDISSGIAQIQPMTEDEQFSMMAEFAIQKSRAAN